MPAPSDSPVGGPRNGSDFFSGAPWYAKLALFVLMNVGVPVVMAAVILAIYAGWFPSPMLLAIQSMDARLARVENDLQAKTAEHARIVNVMEESLKTWRLICFNTARDDAARDRCMR